MNALFNCKESCDGRVVPSEIKEPGIFENVAQTLNTLVEIKNMLNVFRSDIGDGTHEEKFGPLEPHSFRESVELARMVSFDIQNDLKSLIARFR